MVASGFAIREIPISSEPSISRDTCRKIRGSRKSENRGSRRQEPLACWNRDSRYPDGSFKPSIYRDTCQRIPRSRGSALRDFQRQRNCCIRNHDFAISDIMTRSELSIHTGQVSGIGRKSQIGKSEFSRA
jgi:hypothetical protein